MKILALDIGAGTNDILLYERGKPLENCVKMVLPSPSKVFAERVKEATRRGKDVFVNGDIIGGGAFSSALKKHMRKGLSVWISENAAYTIRNNLDEVRETGIVIVEDDAVDEGFNGVTITLEEVNLVKIGNFLQEFNVNVSDVEFVAIAVKDHGASQAKVSNRRFRMQKMRELLEKEPKPESLAFTDDRIPPYFLRMKSAVKASNRQLPSTKVLVMDTSSAAILGCLKDPHVEKQKTIMAVNVGNGHTIAAIIVEGEVTAILEHHTSKLNPSKLEKILVDFAERELSDEDVFNEGGHGLFYLKDHLSFSDIDEIVVTGPKRSILGNVDLNIYYAAPAGDVMMVGPIGLVEAAFRTNGEKGEKE